jgi:signal transduction histidine kinase
MALAGLGAWTWLGRPDRQAAGSLHAQLADARAQRAAQALEAHQLDHDLRAPLGAMAIALDLLQSGDPGTEREARDVLRRQLARLTTLTDRVRALSQDLAD